MTAPRSTSPARTSPTPHRRVMRSSGRRATRRSSRHESVGRPPRRLADAARLHVHADVDLQAARATAAHAAAKQTGGDVDSVKRNWLAAASIFVVACAWGATFSLIKDVLRHIAPEPFIAYRFRLAGVVLIAIAISRRQLTRALVGDRKSTRLNSSHI